MNILLVEPFYADSHKQWIDGLMEFTNHEYTLLSLPGRHWKWRMQGGAIELAKQYNQLKATFDLIIVSDMLNLTTFLALTNIKPKNRKLQNSQTTSIAVYFHENQLTYPWSKTDPDPQLKRDAAYQFINYTSALVADIVLFNSQYHQNSFLEALPLFLNQFPDFKNTGSIETIRHKSKVLPIGLNLKRFDKLEHLQKERKTTNKYPLILWNHRWEYDKNPDLFFKTLLKLKNRGVKFTLAVLGKSYNKQPEIFSKIPAMFKDELQHFGYCKNEQDYIKWLHLADIIPVTTIQDFFGISVVEAIYCNTIPLLPYRLAYPEHFPVQHHQTFFYKKNEDFINRLQRLIFNVSIIRKQNVSQFVAKYDWVNITKSYNLLLSKF